MNIPTPNLFWRGIIITMIPLLLQVIIVVFLAYNLLALKNEIVTESRSQDIIARTFVLNRDAMETIYNLNFKFEAPTVMYKLLPKMPTESNPMQALNENLQGLFNVARTDSESEQRMQELRSCHKELQEMYKDAQHLSFKDNEDRVTSRQRYFHRFLNCARQYAAATTAIVELEEERQARRPALIHDLLSRVWATLVVALILSALLAALLGYMYIVLVKRPLRLTCRNGMLLAKGQPLPPALTGTDELATLDRLLHSTAAALDKIQQDEKTLVENATDLICSLTEDGAFISANPYATRMLGYSPEELVGRNLHELTIPDESFFCDEKLRESRTSTNISVFDLRLVSDSKDIIDTRWSCFWSDAQKAFFCVAHDITETKNAERMKQDLVDMISHDLRSPLTSVNISLAILSRGAKGELPPDAKLKVEKSAKMVEQLIELVSDLLDFQKLSARNIETEPASTMLNELLQKAVSNTEMSAEVKNIRFDISGDATVNVDKRLMTQAITASLDNAIKAAPSDAIIRIEITEIADIVQLRIIDQGEGLSDEEIAQIESSVPTHKLSGHSNRSLLKYSICKQIVEAHYGNISSYSQKPSGFSFMVRLPKLIVR
ncbi:MAG: hypothetical protein DKT66_24035 [Candidatus Melainabacteria bacterium]|nr:MAG: hypothetical protein DKT66_24035 [Candidatus Melainabacteria bacterium]